MCAIFKCVAKRVPRPVQLELPVPKTWGGRRAGAGRPPTGTAGMPHLRRSRHLARHPVHATVRVRRELSWLRSPPVFARVRKALGASSQASFRVVEFSVQRDHLHLLVEAHDNAALSAGMKGLGVRVARAVNRVLGRRGRVWSDRYHARELTSPRAVRNALVYVLHNARKHRASLAWIDPCSSAAWFDGFRRDALTCIATADVRALVVAAGKRPTAAARTWLGGVGWRRLGLVGIDESPRSPT